MRLGIWEMDWSGVPEFKQDGEDKLVIVEGREIAKVRQVENNLFRYSSSFGYLYRQDRQDCIAEGLRSQGYIVYLEGDAKC